VPSVYNWNGFYLGANVGAAWARGILTDNASVASVTAISSGAIGGGTFGYNWQFAPNWIAGIEGTLDGTSIRKTSNMNNAIFLGTPVSIQGSAETKWISTIAGRIGVAQYNWLFYAKGGAGWANDTVSATSVALGALGWVGGTTSASNTATGWLAGAGIEYGLTQHWTIKAEYDYLGLPNWTIGAPFTAGDSLNVSRNISMFSTGVNYKF
jgi:opacity protein-like surface antigen